MYLNLNHILEKQLKYKKWGFVNEETRKYIKSNEVGFKISNKNIKFVSTRRNSLNYDWEIDCNEIIAIAFEEKMIFDDDEQLLIIFRPNSKPIEFIIPSIASEEMNGIKNFIIKLDELFDLKNFHWIQDKTILAYPECLKGRELYKFWKGVKIKLICIISDIFGIKYKHKGVFLKEIIKR